MLVIGFCDDDMNTLDNVYQKVNQIIIENTDVKFTLHKFSSPKEFKKSLKKITYDLVFLDIEMKPISGLDLAEYISETLKNIKIVFVTNHNELVKKTLRYSPIAFISKDIFDEDLEENISVIIDKLKITDTYYTVVVDRQPKKIKVANIICILSQGNNIDIHMADRQVISQRKTFKIVLEEMNSNLMIQANKGLLINVSHIKTLDEEKNTVLLDNGAEYSVSRIYYEDLKNKFFEHERRFSLR